MECNRLFAMPSGLTTRTDQNNMEMIQLVAAFVAGGLAVFLWIYVKH